MKRAQKSLENIMYWASGNSSHQPLIFIHGFTGTHEGFQYIWPLFEEKYRIIIPDLPGFGESKLPDEPWSLAHVAKQTNKFVKALKLKQKPVVISHSMGGLIAAHMLIQEPSLYSDKRIFLSPVATKVTAFDSRKLGEIGGVLQYGAARKVKAFASSKLISQVATKAIITTKEKQLRKDIYGHHYKNLDYISSPNYYYQLHRDINRQGVIDMASSLKNYNTLIVSGNKDNVTPLTGQKKLAAALGAELQIIPGVGHLAHYEMPGEIVLAVRSFLE